ncbi:MAG: hypothetical protein M3T56_03230 [Chloroflexota bacterium]|nr:hypothetical protein [Chloroflexota bacterium]
MSAKKKTNWKQRALLAEKMVATDREYRERGAQEIEKLLDMILPLQRKNRELMEAAGTQEARIAELEAQVRAERAEIEFWVEQSDNFRNQIVEMLRDAAWAAK